MRESLRHREGGVSDPGVACMSARAWQHCSRHGCVTTCSLGTSTSESSDTNRCQLFSLEVTASFEFEDRLAATFAPAWLERWFVRSLVQFHRW